MSVRDLLAAATPRPWAVTGNDNRYGSVASTVPAAVEAFCARWPDHGRGDIAAYGGALIGESIQPADHALIVAAVNEYEALLDIAEAAAGHLTYHEGDDPDNRSRTGNKVADALARLDTLRDAS